MFITTVGVEKQITKNMLNFEITGTKLCNEIPSHIINLLINYLKKYTFCNINHNL